VSFRPRPKQDEVLAYRRGKMGVSAVPGSGKTITLAALAARLVTSGALRDDQEVLIVTLVNSAVDIFAGRVADLVQAAGLLPNVGYRVRTLHGLAHDIVRERPDLVQLPDDFQIVDERLAEQIRREAAEAWLQAHPTALDGLLSPELDERRAEVVRRQQWSDLVNTIAASLIRRAKDLQATPAELQDRLRRLLPQPLPLVEMGAAIYADYQRALAYRGAVDFDDLIRLALRAMELDPDYLIRLRERWPFVLEDEAQDSSRLQERILRLLVGPDGNWVRVGDPNQAIYETFTTADPQFLRDFLEEPAVVRRELPNSGRSTLEIIELANRLIDWTREKHPVAPLSAALSLPHIEPVPAGDSQPNPPADPRSVQLVARKFSPAAELRAVVRSVGRWLQEHGNRTVAILVPRNDRGAEVAAQLRRQGLACIELLRSTRSTREAAGALAHVAAYLGEPTSPVKLALAYQAWRRDDRTDEDLRTRFGLAVKALRSCRQVEDFIWPRADRDWLVDLALPDDAPDLHTHLVEFRNLVRRWQGATLLPVDQLLLTLAQDLFQEQADLAIAHKLAGVLRRTSAAHPEWQLPELAQELLIIARNQRRFLGMGDEDSRFDPDQYAGQVVVATVHRAKGLEWDRVYLTSANNYDFPSAQVHDSFISEPWYVRDQLNPEAEALAQLDALLSEDGAYEEGFASQAARLEYAAERLRLLYVGITRARRELIVTWNDGRRGDRQPATPLLALQTYWEQRETSEGENERDAHTDEHSR
jgi:DNA helicase-2/ATP-dependent DNA helicase PcrA